MTRREFEGTIHYDKDQRFFILRMPHAPLAELAEKINAEQFITAEVVDGSIHITTNYSHNALVPLIYYVDERVGLVRRRGLTD